MSSPAIPSFLSTNNVHRQVLENGLSVLALENHKTPTVTCMIWYRVGSRHERSGETGRSHFLEHMLFKGTEVLKKGEIDLLTMKNGGSNNAFTSYDFTAYYFSFASDRWERALYVEADRMVNTVFEPEEFESEKNVVLEELKANLDQPWGLLMQELNAHAFEVHPYRNPVVGLQVDLKRTDIANMEDYYRAHYHPGNATLVMVGDFNAAATLKKVGKIFGALPSRGPAAVTVTEEPQQKREKRVEIKWRSDIPRVGIAFHAPQIGHEDSYSLHVLSAVLAEGKASRLYQRLVEGDAIATFATAEYGESEDPTLFYIRAEVRGSSATGSIEKGIFEELERIARDGVSDEELSRAKHQIEAQFVMSRERNLDQAILLGQIATLADLDYIDSYLANIASVDSRKIAEACRLYFSEENRTVVWLIPEGEENAVEE